MNIIHWPVIIHVIIVSVRVGRVRIRPRACRVGWGSGMESVVLILAQQGILGTTPQEHANYVILHVLPAPTHPHRVLLVHPHFTSTTSNA